MNTRGISPLIATVLIIGFTIVLAAMVLQWGGGLFKDIQDETSEKSEFSIACSSGIANTEVKAYTSGTTNVEVVVDNKNQRNLETFIVRVRDAQDKVVSFDSTVDTFYDTNGVAISGQDWDTIKSFEVKRFVIKPGGVMDRIEFFPGVKSESGEIQLCESAFKAKIQ